MPGPSDVRCLRDALAGYDDSCRSGVVAGVDLTAGELKRGLAAHEATFAALAGRTVAVTSNEPARLAALLLALDGVCHAILLLPADLPAEHAADFMRRAGTEVWVTPAAAAATPHAAAGWFAAETGPAKPLAGDTLQRSILSHGDASQSGGPDTNPRSEAESEPAVAGCGATPDPMNNLTRWIIPTSGTTGTPKLVSHTLATLTRTIGQRAMGRACAGGCSMIWRALPGSRCSSRASSTGAPLIFTDQADADRCDGSCAARTGGRRLHRSRPRRHCGARS